MCIFRIALNTFRAFFGIVDSDTSKDIFKKVIFVGSKRLMYFFLDYWLAGLTGAVNVFLKATGVDLSVAFLTMWTLNITISYAFVVVYEKTGVDVSLGVEFRRAVERIHSESKGAGFIALFLVLLQAVFWSGPEQIVIFFEKELPGYKRWLALLALTCVQTIIWMYLWRTGYDIVTGR